MSSCNSPKTIREPPIDFYNCDDHEIKLWIQKIGGTSDEIMTNEKMAKLIFQMLRIDAKIFYEYYQM